VVVDNLDFIGGGITPLKADAPLVVDADAVVSIAVSRQRLQVMRWWTARGWSPHECGPGAFLRDAGCLAADDGSTDRWPPFGLLMQGVMPFKKTNVFLSGRPLVATSVQQPD